MATYEKELIKQAKSGNKEAFKSIFIKYKDLVFKVAYKMLGNKEKAEDVLEDVFFYLFTNIEKFREESLLSTYLYRITINQCKNVLKITGREVTLNINELKGEDLRIPQEVLESKETVELVQKVLDSLPTYKEILILVDCEDLSYDEIGKILGISRKQVKDRIYRGRIAFRKKWKELNYEM